MLARYIDAGMETAIFELNVADGVYWGEIPGCPGLWAEHETLAGCHHELRGTFRAWVSLRLRLGFELPEIAGINLNQLEVEIRPRSPLDLE